MIVTVVLTRVQVDIYSGIVVSIVTVVLTRVQVDIYNYSGVK